MKKSFYDGIKNTIETMGHQLIGVVGDWGRPSFTYSIGLSEKYGYELIIVGMRAEYAAAILNDIATYQATKPLEMGVPYSDFSNMPLMFRESDPKKVAEYTVQADQHYGHPVKVIQVVVCDRQGKFPEDVDYETNYMSPRQPLLYVL